MGDRLDLGMVGEEDEGKGKVELVIDTDGCMAQRAENTFVSLTSKPRHCSHRTVILRYASRRESINGSKLSSSSDWFG